MVNEALQQVPNHTGNKNIEQVNRIRESLASMGESNTAFSLPQILEALNKGDIPTTVSLVEVFNKGVLKHCMGLYNEKISGVNLPLSEDVLRQMHMELKMNVMDAFEEQHFGRYHVKTSVERLEFELQKAYENLLLTNEYKSAKLCEGLSNKCEDKMDELQDLRLPSMAKFSAGFVQCNRSFKAECRGPSKAVYEKRIEKMLGKARLQFIKDYNNRHFNWLVGFSLAMVVVGRFALKNFLVEVAAWAMFIFLETYTGIFWSPESLYYNPVWHFIVTVWETVVYSPVLDLDRWAIPLAWLSLILLLVWRFYGKKKFVGGPLLPIYASQRASNNPRARSE